LVTGITFITYIYKNLVKLFLSLSSKMHYKMNNKNMSFQNLCLSKEIKTMVKQRNKFFHQPVVPFHKEVSHFRGGICEVISVGPNYYNLMSTLTNLCCRCRTKNVSVAWAEYRIVMMPYDLGSDDV